jgi:hypothetical protein
MSLVDKIGIDELGKSKWGKMPHEEKLLAAYTVVKDESSYHGSMAEENFQIFLDALNKCVGGNEVQRQLIEKQYAVSLNKLTFDYVIAKEIKNICNLGSLLGRTETPYPEYFWKIYARYSKKSIEMFQSDMDHRALQVAMSQLIEYHAILRQSGADETERRKVLKEMLSLVRVQCWEVLKFIDIYASTPKRFRDELQVFLLECFWDTSCNEWRSFKGSWYGSQKANEKQTPQKTMLIIGSSAMMGYGKISTQKEQWIPNTILCRVK